jgi:DNA-binding transcriptional LysR family regulator
LVARKLADLRMIVCASHAYLEQRGVPQVPADLSHHDCLVFSDAPGIAEWRFDGSAKTARKIRISARLWMNSLDALVTAAKQGAGIVRVPSWQVEADIAAGALQRLLRDYEPPPAPLHLLLGPSRLTSPKCRVFVDYLVERWRVTNPFESQHTTNPSE